MVLTPLRGAIGFLTRLPVGHDDRTWQAFRTTPASLPLAGYVIGGLVALPVLLPFPPATVGVGYVLTLYALTGIAHIDGLADLGDALAVPGDPAARKRAMKDTAVGAGGVLAVGLVVAGTVAAGATIASRGIALVAVVVAAEVAAKLGMACIACLGEAAHEGLGSALADPNGPRSVVIPVLVAVPVAFLDWPQLGPAAVALVGGVAGALAVFGWADRRLGGMSGDVLGAANEIGRVVGLHAGVVAWTLF